MKYYANERWYNEDGTTNILVWFKDVNEDSEMREFGVLCEWVRMVRQTNVKFGIKSDMWIVPE